MFALVVISSGQTRTQVAGVPSTETATLKIESLLLVSSSVVVLVTVTSLEMFVPTDVPGFT